jgi:glutathione S-transferase
VWLWLEERGIPYRVRKVTMNCYGDKEDWYRRLVPSGMLPALELDGQLITESDRILEALEAAFGPLLLGMNDPRVLPLRRLERTLFRAWCHWLCGPERGERGDRQGFGTFDRLAGALADALTACPGPFLLGEELSTADVVFVPYLERMNASLAYYKGYLLRQRHPAIDRWFTALEQRPAYRGSQSDFHTHAHDLPPQMGCCRANGSEAQQALAARIDRGPWPLLGAGEPDPETSQSEPADAAAVALARVLRHRAPLLARYGGGQECFDTALRCALTLLISGRPCQPPAGSAAALRSLAQRISVPRDMPLHAARRLRQALEQTAALDPADPAAEPQPLPVAHRHDQDPRPFLLATPAASA